MSVSSDRRQGVNAGAAIKVPCAAVATAPISLSGEQTIGGIAVHAANTITQTSADRVLVTAQADATANGIYDVSTGPWRRTQDFNGEFDVKPGTAVPVWDGADYALWILTSSPPIIIDTTALHFSPLINTLTTLLSWFEQDLVPVPVTNLTFPSGRSGIKFLNANSITLSDADDGLTYIITNGGGVDFNVNFSSITNPNSPFRAYLIFINAVTDFVVNFLAGMSAWQFFDSSSTGASASRRTFASPSASFVVTHLHPSGGVDAWNVQENPTNPAGYRSDLMLGGQNDVRVTTVLDAGGATPATVTGYLRVTINGTSRDIPFF